MARLFIELYLDEDVNILIADLPIILATRHPPYELVRRLMRILNHVTADEIEEQIRYI